MSETIRPAAARRHPRLPARWATEASQRVPYYAPSSLEKMVHCAPRIQDLVAELIVQARTWGDAVVVGKITAPLITALTGSAARTLPEALTRAQASDAREEIAETAYLSDPSPKHRREFVDALRAQLASTADLIRALEVDV